jgi:hypothetical protein
VSNGVAEALESEDEKLSDEDFEAVQTFQRLYTDCEALAVRLKVKWAGIAAPETREECLSACKELRQVRAGFKQKLVLAKQRHKIINVAPSFKALAASAVAQAKIASAPKPKPSQGTKVTKGKKPPKKKARVVAEPETSSEPPSESDSSSSEADSSEESSSDEERGKRKRGRKGKSKRESGQGEGKWGRSAFRPSTLPLGHPHQDKPHRVEFGAGHRKSFVGLRHISSLTRGGELSLGGWFEMNRFPSGAGAPHARVLGELKFLCYLADDFLRDKTAVATAKSGSSFRLDMIGRRLCMLHAIYEGKLSYAVAETLLPVGAVSSASISEQTVIGLAHLVGAGQKARRLLGGEDPSAEGPGSVKGSGSGKPGKPGGA